MLPKHSGRMKCLSEEYQGTTAIPSHSSGFREFKVYDKARASPDWTSIVSPTECAVFFKDFEPRLLCLLTALPSLE